MENPLYEDHAGIFHICLGTGEEEVERVSQEKAVGEQEKTRQGLQKVLKKEEIRGPRTHMTTGEGFGGMNRAEKSERGFLSNTAVAQSRLPSSRMMARTPGQELRSHMRVAKKGRGSLRGGMNWSLTDEIRKSVHTSH